MRVLACQWNIEWENRERNFSVARDLVGNASPSDLIVLPEMFSTGFSMNVEKVAEAEASGTESFLKNLAGESGAAALGGIVRRAKSGKGYNELIAFSPSGKELGQYRKNRTFRYTGEFDHYENGTEVLVMEWRGWKICPLICYDLRFPELFQRGVLQGAELFVVIASWPTVRVKAWITLLQARAIENQAYVVGVNRCGKDPAYDYPGRSLIIDPWGEIIADAGSEAGSVVAEIDLKLVRDWRKEFPARCDIGI